MKTIEFRCSDASNWSLCTMKRFLLAELELNDLFIQKKSDAINKGVNIHDYMAKETGIKDIPVEYRKDVQILRKLEKELIESLPGIDDFEGFMTQREKQFKSLRIYKDPYVLTIKGTVDCFCLLRTKEQGNKILIIDYKTGQHEVKANSNLQMVLYAYLLIKEYQLVDFEDVYLAILSQLYGVSCVKYSLQDILDCGDYLLKKIKGPYKFHVSNKTCLWCDAKEFCPAYRSNLKGESND